MSNNENDINILLDKFDPIYLLKIAMCRLTLQDVEEIITKCEKVVINIGDGLTLLHQAASFNRPDLVEFLCEKGHPTEVKTVVGETPLDQASWKGHIASALELLKYNADIDSQTNGKYTPLHRCAFYNHPRLASLFVLAGADQTIVDENGQTAYDVAVTQGNAELVQILQPLFDSNGRNITGIAYLTNNPKHPNFRPEARSALFALYSLNESLEGNDEDEDEGEDEDDGN